jgi:nucleoside-diphosphate-sugar epimerase
MTLSGRVLVTGARGFIGMHLVRRLAATGAEVHAADVTPPSPSEDRPGVRQQQLDVRDQNAVARALEGVQTVFHLASVHLEQASERTFEEVNHTAAASLVDLAASAGVRHYVHTSSTGVYGDAGEGAPLREDARKSPRSAYELTKLTGETAVLERARATGLDLVVLRPSWVYGCGCQRTGKLLAALRKGRFVYVGSGRNRRHPIYVDDMLDAYLLAATALPRVRHRIYNIAGPAIMPLRELVETFARVLGVPAPTRRLPAPAGFVLAWSAEALYRLLGRRPPFSRRSLAFFRNHNAWDISAARAELAFEPRVHLEEGIHRTLRELAGVDRVPPAVEPRAG